MRFTHPDHPGRALHLAYCLNLHPAETLDGVLAGLREVTLPLAARLRDDGSALFGVGPWIPADVALALGAPEGAADLERFATFLADAGLDAFTWNAFPWGRFHEPGLKQRVFEPTWADPRRLAFTVAVARVAARVAERVQARAASSGSAGHVSVSTHTGMFGAAVESEADLDACASAFVACAAELARIEQRTGQRVVLSLEAEPRASAGDTAELARFLERVRAAARGDEDSAHARRHLGVCLDACHAAVEFEPAADALARSTQGGTPLGKLQFSSALRLPDPAADERGRERLFALDEPVYLHQVTGRRNDGFARAIDLPELAAAVRSGDADWHGWRACAEWRCHFHVPVDLRAVGDGAAGGLATTVPLADELLLAALARPDAWGTRDLHVEIETYTWNVLPGDVRRGAALVDGLAAEYEHVLALLEPAGWRPS